MEETKNHQSGKGSMCTCPGCMNCNCGWHHGHIIFRIVLVCVLLLIAFWVGVALGELRESSGAYGPRMMYRGGYGYGYPMMQYNGGTPVGGTTTAPATTTTP